MEPTVTDRGPDEHGRSPSEPVRPEAQGHAAPLGTLTGFLGLPAIVDVAGRPIRYRGPPAVLAARLATLQRDPEPSPAALLGMARLLAARGGRLGEAVALARRALLAEQDPQVAREVSEWFAASGRFALAAGTLRTVADELGADSTAAWAKVARWLARAGRGDEAFDVLDSLAAGPMGLTALQEIAALALAHGGAVTAERAVQADVEIARRLESEGASVGEFESWLRAFEAQPDHPHVAEALGAVLVWRGRLGAVDEIYRQRADASGERAASLHAERGADAIRRGDGPTALAALLDAGADQQFDVERLCRAAEGEEWAGPDYDVLLERLGLTSWVAARLQVALAASPPSARAYAALATSLRGSHPDPSAAWLVEAVATDPSDAPIFARLLALGELRPDIYADAMLRLSHSAAVGALERLRGIAPRLVSAAVDGKVGAALGLWASGWVDSDSLDLVSRSVLDVFANEVADAHRDIEERHSRRNEAAQQERIELAALLGEHPERGDDEWHVLLSIIAEPGDNAPWLHRLFRLALRDGRRAELWEALLGQARAASGTPRGPLLAAMALRAGLCAGVDATALLSVFTTELELSSADAPLVAALASWCGDATERARAMARTALALPASLRAAVGAASATALLRLADHDGAWNTALDAFHADPSLARAAGALAEVAAVGRGREAADALERALQVVVPSAKLCSALARLYDGIEAPLLATAWTQRWLALRPGDPEVLGNLLQRTLATRRPPRVLEAIEQVLSAPLSAQRCAEMLAPVLTELSAFAPKDAAQAARRVLAELGSSHEGLRRVLRDLAVRADDALLAASTLEHWLDAAPVDAEGGWLALARRRRVGGHPEVAAEALWLAAQAGASADALLGESEALSIPEGGDGRLWAEEVQALALDRAGRSSQAAVAWRAVASLRWDAAQDPAGAMLAWEEVRRLEPAKGLEILVGDLVEHAGLETATQYLSELCQSPCEAPERARRLTLLAAAELQAGHAEPAFASAVEALQLEPVRTDALAVAEAASSEQGLQLWVAMADEQWVIARDASSKIEVERISACTTLSSRWRLFRPRESQCSWSASWHIALSASHRPPAYLSKSQSACQRSVLTGWRLRPISLLGSIRARPYGLGWPWPRCSPVTILPELHG
jgi:hypothetical protein